MFREPDQRQRDDLTSGAPAPKAVALVLIPALVLMLAFAFFYVGAFHQPTPHGVPLAVIGPPAVAAQLGRLPGDPLDPRQASFRRDALSLINDRKVYGAFHKPAPHGVPIAVIGPRAVAAQLGGLPGDPLDARQASSRRDALSLINDRKVYGAYEAATNRLFVASAANRATAISLQETFDLIAAAHRSPPVRITDVKPLPASDPNGTSAFYAVVAWMFGGYIASTLIGLIGAARSTSRRRAAARIGALAWFSVVGGIVSVLILRACFGVFAGHMLALCAIAVLTIFASGAATAGIQAAAGPAGTGLVILVFVILGNSASGGPFARPLLPGLWRTIGGVLPPGASVDLARSALYFDGVRILGPILVLAAWAAVGTLLALALGGRIMNPVDVEARAAAGAAV